MPSWKLWTHRSAVSEKLSKLAQTTSILESDTEIEFLLSGKKRLAKTHDRSAFNCGEMELNSWLREQAGRSFAKRFLQDVRSLQAQPDRGWLLHDRGW